MAISVCQFYTDFKGANNTWQQGHFRPQSFVYALHEAQMEIFNVLRKEWEKSQVVSDALRPFFISVQVPINDMENHGIVSYPKDYSSFSSLRFFSATKDGPGVPCAGMKVLTENKKCRPLREEEKAAAADVDKLIERPIAKVDNKRWGSVLEHKSLYPSVSRPYSTQYSKGFVVEPKEIGFVVLDYLSLPERPVFSYTKDAVQNIICVPAKCTNLLWSDEQLPELMSRVKTKYASFISNQQKYLEGVKETQTVGS